MRLYCFKRPQYFWAPVSQQPVFLHNDWRAPQLVTQIDNIERSGFFWQATIQRFCSPLHRIGTARTDWEQSRARPIRPADSATIL